MNFHPLSFPLYRKTNWLLAHWRDKYSPSCNFFTRFAMFPIKLKTASVVFRDIRRPFQEGSLKIHKKFFFFFFIIQSDISHGVSRLYRLSLEARPHIIFGKFHRKRWDLLGTVNGKMAVVTCVGGNGVECDGIFFLFGWNYFRLTGFEGEIIKVKLL